MLYRFGLRRTRRCDRDTCRGVCVEDIFREKIYFRCRKCHDRHSIWKGTEWNGCHLTYTQWWYFLVQFIFGAKGNCVYIVGASPNAFSAFRGKAQKICRLIMQKPEQAVGGQGVVVQIDETYFMRPGFKRLTSCPTKTRDDYPGAI